ncbi:MAG: hypothetical protein R3F65_10455, partial [bacterium]|nr:hypothetical protein [Myxococcales bacterium]
GGIGGEGGIGGIGGEGGEGGIGGVGGVGGEGGMGGAPAPMGPEVAGPFAVVVEEDEVELGPRGGLPESVAVTVYRPQQDGVFPAVVFNHGFSLPPSGYASFGRRLASHGIITVMPLYDDNPFAARSHLGLAQDTIGVIDWLLDGPYAARVDGDAIGTAGHSRGGKHAIHAAILDRRIGAVFGLDPVDSAPPFAADPVQFPSVAPELMNGLLVPNAYIGAGLGAQGFAPCAPAGDNYQSFFEAATPPTTLYYIAQAGHQNFVDACAAGSQDLTCTLCPNGGIAGQVQGFALTTVTAFFRWHLAGDAAMRPWVDGAAVDAVEFVEVRRRGR